MSGICISRKKWSQRHLCFLLLAWETGKLDMLPSIGRWADRRLAPHPLWQHVSQLPTGIHRVIGRAGCLRSVAFEWVASSKMDRLEESLMGGAAGGAEIGGAMSWTAKQVDGHVSNQKQGWNQFRCGFCQGPWLAGQKQLMPYEAWSDVLEM
jgi:hypothetical protein